MRYLYDFTEPCIIIFYGFMESPDYTEGFPVTQSELNHLQKGYKPWIGYMMENWSTNRLVN